MAIRAPDGANKGVLNFFLSIYKCYMCSEIDFHQRSHFHPTTRMALSDNDV